jgi:hypothetical protein
MRNITKILLDQLLEAVKKFLMENLHVMVTHVMINLIELGDVMNGRLFLILITGGVVMVEEVVV